MSYFSKFNRKGIPFMEGAEKAELKEVFGQQVHIVDYGYIDGKDGKFAVLKLQECAGKFYFANAIITEMLLEVDKDNMKAELAGEPVVFNRRTSKDGREYIAYEFVNVD